MDITILFFIGTAFSFGMIANFVGLPPMLGFLFAGFALNLAGFQTSQPLHIAASLGVTLLLFSIGLKLNIRTLFKTEVWGSASLYMIASILFFSAILFLLKFTGFKYVHELNNHILLLIAFSLSFSSTVFAVKVLEEKGETNALYGRIAIGILIMQDIFAVLFLTLSDKKIPSAWALLLLGLPLIRPLLYRLLDRVGKGELLVLYGFFLALVVGAGVFQAVGLKADLGALIAGMLVAGHPSAKNMAKALFNMKELFLVCFFLTIGLAGKPTMSHLLIACVLSIALLGKVMLYFITLNSFKLRSRTSLFASLSLANYSEFGLIVVAVGMANGWLSSNWLTIIALAVSLSFMIATFFNKYAEYIYNRNLPMFKRFQFKHLHKDDRPLRIGDAQILVLGMGRVGSSAYDSLKLAYGDTVLGIDYDPETTLLHRKKGRQVITGDALDSDFWSKLQLTEDVKFILLTMPNHNGNLFAAEQLSMIQHCHRNCQDKPLKNTFCNFKVAALARYKSHEKELNSLGVDPVYNLYEEAGLGFARHVWSELTPLVDVEPSQNER